MNNNNEGWIKIHRRITQHWIWSNHERLKWWLDLLFMATHKCKKVLSDNRIITLQAGQMEASISFLSNRWGRCKDVIIAYLHLLEQEGMIKRHVVGRSAAIITICNYDSYQIEQEQSTNTNSDSFNIGQNEPTQSEQADTLNSGANTDEQGVPENQTQDLSTDKLTPISTPKQEQNKNNNSRYSKGLVDKVNIVNREVVQGTFLPKVFGRPSYSKDNFDERKQSFYAEVQKFNGEYSAELLNNFYNYWTQCNGGSYKMLWEKERDKKSFAIKNRLAYWNSREHKRTNNYGNNNNNTRTAFTEDSLRAVVNAGYAMHDASTSMGR